MKSSETASSHYMMKYKENNGINELFNYSVYRLISTIVGIIILAQGATNILPQISIGSVNVSSIDLLALLGTSLLLVRSVYFHLVIIALSMLFIADNITFQSYIRDIYPVLYIGFIFFGLQIQTLTALKIIKIFTYFLFFISSFYLFDSTGNWYRFNIIADAEVIIIFIVSYQGIISKQRLFTRLKPNIAAYNVATATIILAQVVNGSRTITIIALIIIFYQLIKNYNLVKLTLRLSLLSLLTALSLMIFRPLSFMRIIDLISGKNDAMGSVTIAYRQENYIYLWEKILAHPILGNGFGKYHFFEFGLKTTDKNPAWLVHNDYLALLYYYGFLGLFIIMIIIIYSIDKRYKIKSLFDSEKNIFFIALALLATNTPLIGNDTTGPLLWLFLGMILIKKTGSHENILKISL